MSLSVPYELPKIIGGQYILTSFVRELPHAYVYAATQKDLQREVHLVTMRPEAKNNPAMERFFLETARLQASIDHPSLSCALELLYAEGTWHFARERVNGEPLDMMLANGRLLSASRICVLLQQICRVSIYFDIRRVCCRPLQPELVYQMDFGGFRFENMAIAGEREPNSSQEYLRGAVKMLLPLLDRQSLHADQVLEVMQRMRGNFCWQPLSAVLFDEELIRLQMEISRLHAKA